MDSCAITGCKGLRSTSACHSLPWKAWEWRSRGQAGSSAARLTAEEPTTGATRLSRLLYDGERVVAQVCAWLEIRWNTASGDGESPSAAGAKRGPSQLTQLMALMAERCELFHDATGVAYATITVSGHEETWPLASARFRRWLSHTHYTCTGTVARSQALHDAIEAAQGTTFYGGHECDVWRRVAEHEGRLYVDLCDGEWRAVEIDATGWRVVDCAPVKFLRTPHMSALPTPIRGASLNLLRQFVNVCDEDQPLLVARRVSASSRPLSAAPLAGQQGSAKTTTARAIRALIDPSRAPARSAPRDERDLAIAANNTWVLAFDNLSRLHPWLSDALCRLSTGGAHAVRALYTNDEEAIFQAQRPVILTSIEEVVTASDLLDRAVALNLPPILERARQTEEAFWHDFDQAHSALVGALFDVLSAALRRLPGVTLTEHPRMADFARLGVAVEQSLTEVRPGGFMEAYTSQRREADHVALETSVVGSALVRWWTEWEALHPDAPWEGAANELLTALNESAGDQARHSRSWPRTPRALVTHLQRLAPNFRTEGLSVDRLPRGPKTRLWKIERIAAPPSQPSSASVISADAWPGSPRVDDGHRVPYDGDVGPGFLPDADVARPDDSHDGNDGLGPLLPSAYLSVRTAARHGWTHQEEVVTWTD